ncbi:MAG TPA: hypothetical protein VE988_16315, partial [Gemmataceae bacterium]|nr:hypothetical protein [Gemmataceae bacterium]
MANLNLIHFLDFYFTLMFFIGAYRRFGQYREMGRFALTGPARWPRLLELVKHHRTIFITWSTVLPGVMALLIASAQLIASRHLWPHATLTAGELAEMWPALIAVVPLALGMFGVDLYFAIDVSH